jgi:hypothetical protein
MNPQHLEQLRTGTASWNEWRRRHPNIRPDLSGAELNRLNKSLLHHRAGPGQQPSAFQIFRTKLLDGVDLNGANLQNSKIWEANLDNADLRKTDLSRAELRQTSLQNADMRESDLRGAAFLLSNLSGARLDGAIFGNTHFAFTSLAACTGFEQTFHERKTYLDQFTIAHSIPLSVSFLQRCGLTEELIGLAKTLAQESHYHPCFISYSRRNEEFVSLLRRELTRRGIASWFAPEDLRDEQDLEHNLYTFVDSVERIVLVLSPAVLPSNWVDKEVQRGLSQESRSRTIIIPVLYEDIPEPSSREWTGRLLRRGVLDVRNWREPRAFEQSLEALLQCLSRHGSAPTSIR